MESWLENYLRQRIDSGKIIDEASRRLDLEAFALYTAKNKEENGKKIGRKSKTGNITYSGSGTFGYSCGKKR